MKAAISLACIITLSLLVWSEYDLSVSKRARREDIKRTLSKHGEVKTIEFDPSGGVWLFFDSGRHYKKVHRWEVLDWMHSHGNGTYRRIYPLDSYGEQSTSEDCATEKESQ